MKNLSFILIAVSQFISLIGGNVLHFSIALHILDITGSAEIFATILAIAFIPRILLTPLGGVIADRFPKKITLVVCDSANTVLVGILAVILFGGSESMILLGVLVAFMTIVTACYHPTVTASLPAILKQEEMVKANGIIQGIKAVSGLIGPIAAGFLFSSVGINNLVLFCIALYLFSSIINIFIRIPFTKSETTNGMLGVLAELKDGFMYITKVNPVLFKMAAVLFLVVLFYQALLSVAFPYLIRVTFAMSEEAFGLANAALGASILLASLLAGPLKRFVSVRHMPYYIIGMGICTVSVALSVMGSSGILFFTMVGSFCLIMFIFTFVNILVLTYTQTQVPPDMVGKTVAINISLITLSAPIGLFMMGILLDRFQGAMFIVFFGISMFTIVLGVISKLFIFKINGGV